MTRIVSKAQYRWLYAKRSDMRLKGIAYDRKTGLYDAKMDYLLSVADYDALPERSSRFTPPATA